VFKGRSKLLLGRGPWDDEERHGGVEVDVERGDVIVLPVSSGDGVRRRGREFGDEQVWG